MDITRHNRDGMERPAEGELAAAAISANVGSSSSDNVNEHTAGDELQVPNDDRRPLSDVLEGFIEEAQRLGYQPDEIAKFVHKRVFASSVRRREKESTSVHDDELTPPPAHHGTNAPEAKLFSREADEAFLQRFINMQLGGPLSAANGFHSSSSGPSPTSSPATPSGGARVPAVTDMLSNLVPRRARSKRYCALHKTH